MYTKVDTIASDMSEDITFGKWLRQRRRMLDLSQRAFANQVGCARITLSRIEADTLKPSRDLALIILNKIGIPQDKSEAWVSFARGKSSLPIFKQYSPMVHPKTNLPSLLTSFIGREKEQAEILKLITKHRLITLTGSGGVGKTRLSLRIGEQVLRDYVDGVWLVELASLSDPALLPQTIAASLGVTAQSNLPITTMLINFLRTKSLLLLLDNCEHLLDACAQLTDILLKKCPQLIILATSREALGVLGEVIYRVPSLRLPDARQLLEKFRDYESVRLFEERAQLAQTDFSLTLENASFITQICSRLDGIPLAIELAAARVNIFSTEQIAAQLNENFNLLTEGSRTALPRQKTIRASIDWSWDLLTDFEQILLRRLAIFTGGWSLEAAQTVCCDDHIKADQVMGLMSQLVRKSLITVNQSSNGETRFGSHEMIRHYMREKLMDAGDVETLQNRHLEYFLNFSKQAGHELIGAQQIEWHKHILDDLDNLRTALTYSAENNHVKAGLSLASNLRLRFWESYDIHEGLTWLTKFIDVAESNAYPDARANALFVQGGLLYALQKFGEAHLATDEALALFRNLKDPQGEIDALLLLGGILQFKEGLDRKVEFQQEALRLARSIGDVWREARALAALGWDNRDLVQAHKNWLEAINLFRQESDWHNLITCLGVLGESLATRGEMKRAKQLLDEAHEVNQRINNRREPEFVLTGYGYLALMDGDYNRAHTCFEENARNMSESGNRMGYLWARARLGFVLLLQRNIQGAHEILPQTLRDFYKDGNREGVVFTTDRLASLFVANNKFNIAAQLIGWIDSRLTNARGVVDQSTVNRDIETVCAHIGKTAYEEVFNKGRAMTLDEAVMLALNE